VTLRPLTAADVEPLFELMRHAEVCRWWPVTTTGKLRDEVFDPEVSAFAVEIGGGLAGVIQYWEEDEPDYRHAGIDIALGANHRGSGLGPEALRLLARHLVEDRGHHRITIDPALANERAIAAYAKVGFRPVGVLRQYERDPAGGWRDGLLMDLLADELAA
jgi:aminoglycoside 6'-N-acetyltransferase